MRNIIQNTHYKELNDISDKTKNAKTKMMLMKHKFSLSFRQKEQYKIVIKWCDDNINGEWNMFTFDEIHLFLFKESDDAMIFKLRWC
jgi:hypothetical protein